MNAAKTIRKSQLGCDVLLAVDAYAPWSGGSRIYYDNLYRRLAEQHALAVRVETTHCFGDAEFDRARSCSSLVISRRGVRFPDWKLKRAPAVAARMMRIVLAGVRIAPAAIHCGDLFPQALAGLMAHKGTGVPLLVFVHGDEVSQTDGRRLQPRIRNAIYRGADAIVAANVYAFDKAVAIRGNAERVTTITPGVDCMAFAPGTRPEWIARKYELGNSPVILTVGRLVKKKGHETVLRSLPEVLKGFPDLKYLVVGSGPEETRLRELAEALGITHCVRFTGDVPHHDLSHFYRAGDLFCMVNQQDASGDIESFGMVFLEAGASGKPVIGGRSGGTAQSIVEGQTGFLCQPGDCTELSQMLLLVLGNVDVRKRMGEAGLRRARLEFDWDVSARKLLEVHQRMTATKDHSSGVRRSCTTR